MAKVTTKNGVTSWQLDDDELNTFKSYQSERIANDRSKITDMIDTARRQYNTVADGLGVDGWTNTQQRVDMHKNIFQYQNNLMKLKSYGYDVDDQLDYTNKALKVADSRSQLYSNFKSANEYEDYSVRSRLEDNLKDASFDDIQNLITDTEDTIKRQKRNGDSSKLIKENERKLKFLYGWQYKNDADYDKALNVIATKISAEQFRYSDMFADTDDIDNNIELLNTSRELLKYGKQKLVSDAALQKDKDALSGFSDTEIKLLKEYNKLEDEKITAATTNASTAIFGGDGNYIEQGKASSAAVLNAQQRGKIESYFKKNYGEVKKYATAQRNIDNEELAKEKAKRLREQMEASKAEDIGFKLINPLLSAFSGIASTVGKLAYGLDVRYNPYDSLSNASETITQKVNEDVDEYVRGLSGTVDENGELNAKGKTINKVLTGGYNLYNTMVESAVLRGVGMGGGMSHFNSALYSLNAFASTLSSQLDAGADKGKAIATAVFAGVFEALFEEFSIEKLKMFQTSSSVMLKDFLKNSAKQFITEGSEELFTDFANTISDQLINGDASELSKRMQELVASGMSYSDAKSEVAKEYAMQEADTFIIGGLSGSVSGAVHTGIAAGRLGDIGKSVNKDGYRSQLAETAKTVSGNADIDAARAAVENDIKKNKKGAGANLRTGNLYSLTAESLTNDMQSQRQNAVKNGMKDALVNLGTSKSTAAVLGDITGKAVSGEKLTGKEKKLVKSMRTVTKTIDSLNERERGVFYAAASDSKLNTENKIKSFLTKTGGIETEKAGELTKLISDKQNRTAVNYSFVLNMQNYGALVDAAYSEKANATGETLNKMNRYVSGIPADSAVAVKTDESGDGTAVGVSKFINIDRSGHTATVELSDGTRAVIDTQSAADSDIIIPDKSENYIYNKAGTMFDSAESANAFVTGFKKSGLDATEYVKEFNTVMSAGRENADMPKSSKLNGAVASIAYDIGADASVKAYKATEGGARIKGNRNFGAVELNALNSGVHNYTTTSGANTDAEMKIASEVLDAYGKKHNIKFVLVDSISSDAGRASGMYSSDNGVIYISSKSQDPLSVTAGHEVFHYVKNNNATAGKELQEYIISRLKNANNYDYNARFAELAKLYNTDNADAVNEEIAANSMFDIMNEETIKELATNHKGLLELVKNKLDEIVGYLKNAVEKYAAFKGSKEAKALRYDREALERIRSDIDKALAEIESNEQTKKTDTKENNKKFAEKFSLEENDDIVQRYEEVSNENEGLKKLNSILRAELKRSPANGTVSEKGEIVINEIAENLVKKYKSDADYKSIANSIVEILNYAAKNKIDVSQVTQAVAVVVKDVVRTSSLVYERDSMESERKELRRYLRDTPLRIADEAKSLIKDEYGSYEKFRRAYLSRIRLTNDSDAPYLDTIWSEMTDRFAGLFISGDDELDSVHQPLRLAEVINEKGDIYYSQIGESDLQTLSLSLAADIMKDYAEQSPSRIDKQSQMYERRIRDEANKNKQKATELETETKKTGSRVTEKGHAAIEYIAGEVIKEHFGSADSKTKKAAKALFIKEVTNAYAKNGNKVDFNSLVSIARRIIAKSSAEVSVVYGQENERLRFSAWMRKNKVQLSEEQRSYVEREFGAGNELGFGLSQMFSGGDNAPMLSDRYAEIKKEFPSLFIKSGDDSPQGQIDSLYNAYNPILNDKMPINKTVGQDRYGYAHELATYIMNTYAEMSKTYADKLAERDIAERNKYKQELKQSLRTAYTNAVTRIEDSYRDRIEKLGAAVIESREIRYDLEEKRYQRARIRAEIRNLSKKTIEPTKTSFIPTEIRGAVAKFLNVFTQDNLMFKKEDLAELSSRYRAVMNNEVDDDALSEMGSLMNEQIAGYIDELNETIGGKRLRFSSMSLEQLKKIKDIVRNLNHAVVNYNTVSIAGRKVDMYERAKSTVDEMPKNAEQMRAFRKLSELYDSGIKYGNLTPYYFFRRMGGTFQELYSDLFNGEMEAAQAIRRSSNVLGELYEKHNVKNWVNSDKKISFTTERGVSFQMSYNQMLDLYGEYKTMLADSKEGEALHLTVGGIVFLDEMRTSKKSLNGKFEKKHGVTYELKDKTPVQLTINDIEAVIKALGDKTKFADDMIKYLSGDIAKMANRASVELYGYEMFDKDTYYPIKTAAYYTGKARNADDDKTKKPGLIKNMGATNQRIYGAKNPVVVRNFTEVCAQHISDMISFTYMGEAQSNLFRMLNYRSSGIMPTESAADGETGAIESVDAVNMRTSLDNAYGEGAARYIDTLINDLSSGVSYDAGEEFSTKLLSSFKKLAVMANLSVVVQQPTAVMRAMALIDPKYFVNKVTWNKSYEEAMLYAGTAVLKDIGGYDMNNNRSAVGYLLDYGYDAKDKAKAFNPLAWNKGDNASLRDDVYGAGAEKADAVTWSSIWEACKKETAAKTDLTGEELLKKAGRRFDEVIEATQVYDSVLSRSQFMRGRSLFTKMATSFMAEPTKTLNMFMDANYQRWIKKEKGSRVFLARTVAALVMSNVLNALVKSLVSSLRKDPDKGYMETYASEVLDNFIDGSAITGMMPFIKDIISIFQGEDITRDDLTPLMDIYNAIQYADKPNADVWDKINAVLVPLGLVSGVPLRNLSRDIRAMFNIVGYAKNENTAQGIKYSLKDTINEQVKLRTFDKVDVLSNTDYERMFKLYDEGKVDEATQLRDEIKAYLVYTGKSEKQADDMLSTRIKKHITENSSELLDAVKAHMNGNVSEYSSLMNAVKTKYDEQLVVAAEKSIESDIKNAAKYKSAGNEEQYTKYKDKLLGYGYSESDISNLVSGVKVSSDSDSQQYDGMYTHEDAVRAYVSGNKELYTVIYDEMGQKLTQIKNALKKLYIAGDVTKEQTTSMYLDMFAKGDDQNEKSNETYFILEKWEAEASGEEYNKYGSFLGFVDEFVDGKTESLDDIKNEINNLAEHGIEKSGLKSKVTSEYKPKLQEMYKNDRNSYVNYRAKLASVYVLLGDDRAAALKKINKWVK